MTDATKARYWIAINGPSCARTTTPLRDPKVSPTPEQLIGFPSDEEARAAQRICLEEPMETVRQFLESLRPHVRSGVIRVIQPSHPQPPSTGAPTLWMEADFSASEYPGSTMFFEGGDDVS
jgi:hypothetical protein